MFTAAFGAAAFPIYSLCAAHTNDHVESDGFVEAASGLLLTYSAGAIAGPVIASAAMQAQGRFGAVLVYGGGARATGALRGLPAAGTRGTQ